MTGNISRLIENAIRTDETRTCAVSVRIVHNRLSDIPGRTILEKRRCVSDNLDHLRRRLLWEPRGHRDMSGVVLGRPHRRGFLLR